MELNLGPDATRHRWLGIALATYLRTDRGRYDEASEDRGSVPIGRIQKVGVDAKGRRGVGVTEPAADRPYGNAGSKHPGSTGYL